MHRLSTIQIRNFKSIKDCEFKLSDYTPLIGYNNAGKSNLIKAIKWLFQKSVLNADDFYNPANPIEIIGTISGISQDLLDQLDASHKKAIEKYITDGTLLVRRYQESPETKAANIKLHVRKNEGDDWTVNPAGIDNAIAAIFPDPIHIGAMEDAEEDVSKSKASSTIGKLLAKIIEPIEKKYGAQIKTELGAISKLLDADSETRADELLEFDNAMNKKIGVFFQGVNVKVHVPTPDLKEVFGKGTLKVFENGRTGGKDVGSLGHGAQRSIQMALVQYLSELEKFAEETPTRTMLLIDEPELYLHPQAIEVIRDALKTLSKGNYQIIFSTHSALMITERDMATSILIRKSLENGTHKKHTLHEAVLEVLHDKPSQTKHLFSLSNASNILFSEKVLLIEGTTEQRLLPTIFENITGKTIAISKLALVNITGSGGTKKSIEILNVMGLQSRAIVDLDYIFRNAAADGFLRSDDENLCACKEILSNISEYHGIKLDGEGLPTRRGSSMSAADAFALLASQDAVKPHIAVLHEKMRAQGIWVWKNGTIENHLGLTTKSEEAWASFVDSLESKTIDDIAMDAQSIHNCIEWLNS